MSFIGDFFEDINPNKQASTDGAVVNIGKVTCSKSLITDVIITILLQMNCMLFTKYQKTK